MYRWEKEIGYRTNASDQYCEKQYDRKNMTRKDLEDEIIRQQFALRNLKRRIEHVNPDRNPKLYTSLIRSESECIGKIRRTRQKLSDHDYGKRSAIKTNPKKQNLTVLEARVLKQISEIRKNPNITYITKEDMARALHARESQIEQVFMILNRKGILRQPQHRAPHDSNRDPWGYDNSTWQGDFYYFTN